MSAPHHASIPTWTWAVPLVASGLLGLKFAHVVPADAAYVLILAGLLLGGDDMGEFQPQQSTCDKRHDPGPGRDGIVVRRRHRSIRSRECASLQEKAASGKSGDPAGLGLSTRA